MEKNIFTVGLIALFLTGVLTSGCIGKEKSLGEQPTSAAVSEWESAKSEASLVKVVNFLESNKGGEVELAGEKHRVTGEEKIDIEIKMLECCTEGEFNDLINSISINGEVKDSDFSKKSIHASVPVDEIPKIDEVWNVERIDFEPEARDYWMQVVGEEVTQTQAPITKTTPAPTTVAPTTHPPTPQKVCPMSGECKQCHPETEPATLIGPLEIKIKYRKLFIPGATFDLTINIKNTGEETVHNVRLSIIRPDPDFEIVGEGEWNLGDLDPNDKAEATTQLKLSRFAGMGKHKFYIEVHCDEIEPLEKEEGVVTAMCGM